MTDKKALKEKEIIYPSFEEVVEINKYITTGEGKISPKRKEAIDKMNAALIPRPLERIPQILDALKTIWEKYPDQRLGQLLLNYVFHDADYRDKTSIEMYAQEDNITLENLLKKIKSEKASKG